MKRELLFKRAWVQLLVLLLIGLPVALVADTSLYSAEAEIIDDSATARKKSIEEAFHQVLIQVTGDGEVTGRAGIPQLITQASDYVQQFRYRLEKPAADQPDQPPKRFIVVQFDKASVDRALSSTSARAWSGSRPRVLVWLAQEVSAKRHLVNPETELEITHALNSAAGKRGVPLQLPLMDLQDQSNLTAGDIWAGYEAAILNASSRYPHNIVLTGKITGSGKNWRIKWLLLDQGKSQTFHSSGSVLSSALADGIEATANKLLHDYAPVADGEGGESVLLRIVAVESTADYIRAMKILNNLDVVKRAAVSGGHADELIIRLWLAGSMGTLERTLALDGQLVPATHVVSDEADIPDREPELSYRLY